VKHIVLFEWKPATTDQMIDAALDDVRSLSGKVPEIIALECGQNMAPVNDGFTHYLIVELADSSALSAYRQNPHHQQVARQTLDPIIARRVVLDTDS